MTELALFRMPETAYRRRSCPVCGGAWSLPRRPGTVTYAVQRQGWVKIGKTADLPRRLMHLRLGVRPDHSCWVTMPAGMDPAEPLILLRTWRGDREHQLHVRFSGDHAAGEWFRPSPRMVRTLSVVSTTC